MLQGRYHIEVAKGTPEANKEYCSKDANFIEQGTMVKSGTRSDINKLKSDFDGGMSSKDLFDNHGDLWFRHERSLRKQRTCEKEETAKTLMTEQFKEDDVVLKSWQKKCIKQLDEQSEREILFVVDTTGNTGKTFLAKYLYCNREAYYTNSTVYVDVIYGYNNEPLVIFDLVRDKIDFLNYGLLESFKNGIAFNRKYKVKVKIFKPCKVIVFMNEDPNFEKISADRYVLFTEWA